MKKKISELELYQIDYLVAKAEKFYDTYIDGNKCRVKNKDTWNGVYSPTTNPSQAWPIIERERIYNYPRQTIGGWSSQIASENIRDPYIFAEGKTSLESAMRCFVAYKFGEEVEI
jgi:hypothetical protein